MTEDSKKELELLEQQLSDNEEWFLRELDSAKRLIGQLPDQPAVPRTPAATTVKPDPNIRNYANGYGQPAAAQVEEAPMPKKKGSKGLLILALLETLGILGLAAYWVLYLLR